MKTYARIDDGVVAEIIGPLTYNDGSEIPMTDRFPSVVLATMVDITTVSPPPAQGWVYNGATFSPPAAPAPTLAQAQAQQIAAIYYGYQSAVQVPVSYKTVAGVVQTFQADTASQNTLLIATTGYDLAGATPDGFYWVALDNAQVPFALDDLKGLYGVMLAQGNEAFNKLQTLKAAVRGAATVEAVASVTWS